MIETTTDLIDKVQIYKKYDRTIIVFSLEFIISDDLLDSRNKRNPRNRILTQNWFKERILGEFGASSDD